eukprot:995035-Rhodomonas_salina.1
MPVSEGEGLGVRRGWGQRRTGTRWTTTRLSSAPSASPSAPTPPQPPLGGGAGAGAEQGPGASRSKVPHVTRPPPAHRVPRS